MKYIKAILQFCAYLFVPQMGRRRRRIELLKKDITYLIGIERAEGNLSEITAEQISATLNAPIEEVKEVLKEL